MYLLNENIIAVNKKAKLQFLRPKTINNVVKLFSIKIDDFLLVISCVFDKLIVA